MNKHFFKRIIESIITRKKDSLLIFFIIFFLSFFIVVSVCISRLGYNISSTVLSSMNMNIYIQNLEIEQIKVKGFGALVNKTLINLEDNIKELAERENANFEIAYSSRLSSNFDYAHLEDDYIDSFDGFYNRLIYSGTGIDAFNEDGLTITNGRYFNENEEMAALILNNTYINNEKVNIGDILSIKINDRIYDYPVVGLFEIDYSNNTINNKKFYNDATVILSKNSMLQLCNDANIAPNISRLDFSFKNGYRYEALKDELKECINDTVRTTRLNGRLKNNHIESNYDDYKKLIAPSNNMSILYSIISIIISFISCLLLINIVIYLNDKRLKEFAILQSLGQSKILSIISFALEILIIANIAITIAIPIGIKTARISSNELIRENLKMQDRLAYISNNQEDIDIFKQQSEIYTNYTINVATEDILIIYVVINGLVLLSCLYVFISISKIRPRVLLTK